MDKPSRHRVAHRGGARAGNGAETAGFRARRMFRRIGQEAGSIRITPGPARAVIFLSVVRGATSDNFL